MRELVIASLTAFTRCARGFTGSRSDTVQHTILIITLTALAFGLRLYRLDAQSLWLDEGSTWIEVTGKGWLALVGELFSPNAGYPLYHLLLKAWVSLAGDSEWALRFPSALAGALVAPVLMAAARELRVASGQADNGYAPAAVGLLAALSPYALWYAQDAKVYSLLILASALLVWTLLRALRSGAPCDWLLFAGAALTSIFVHRLAMLSLTGAALAIAWRLWQHGSGVLRWKAGMWATIALALSIIGVAGVMLATRDERMSGERSAVGMLEGLWFTFAHFSLNRWPGELEGYLGLPALVWLLPFGVLTAWGVALLLRDARAGHDGASVILGLFLAPLALFAIVHTRAPVYEARYAASAFPAWLLILAYPLLACNGDIHASRLSRGSVTRLAFATLFVTSLAACVTALVQPEKGLFSGDPVKEQWREAVAALAARVHPDDLVLVHPHYVMPMYAYYAPRVTPDPLPQPVTFPVFAEGDTCGIVNPTRQQMLECIRRRFEPFYNQQAIGKKRALLLIAPDHARAVDPPPLPVDRFGWVGLRFQYPQRTWPCGGAEFVGVLLMCQSFPETFNPGGPGTIPQPDQALEAVFGGELRLRGVTLALHGGAARAGGALPVTLYWEAVTPPTHNYRMFLHLCRDCDVPPVANDDGPPLGGYAPAGLTSTWRIGDPVHDERVLMLPRDLPPGRYTLLLGVYSGDGAPDTRLPITTSASTLSENRLVVGTITVIAP
ncbi:MAG: glycosyltransferase family 39 protein [Roseiflexus sp.]|nr:glycosyltransferase family 39 protein [Roseiflexus sp.]MCS7290049.1 glycosyltransferase family 39 protein [Roseiflexus sp.]MDW8148488.1 glycosyltransferase family 39 protein [Roseiflexaceae bacterium]MDW8232152.1 glycosyltransferase family 39 protein [Roseiflexaceae bacterium]